MGIKLRPYQPLIFILLIATTCKEPYISPVIVANNNYLVVDGIINNGDSSRIVLSRTRNLGDTAISSPESFAAISIVGEAGDVFSLEESAKGIYTGATSALNINEKYQIRIITGANVVYESDFVPVQTTPAIDSISWERNKNVDIFVSTHDPANQTKYYRWNFSETWEYHSFYDSNLGFANGQVYFRDSSDLLTFCWRSDESNEILLATSANLNEDVINHFRIATVPEGSDKISVRYSILLRQYALTKEAFEYWQLLKKNTEEVGTIFGSQPSQLKGNIHCVTNPTEPVIGFISASTVTEKRAFILRREVYPWPVLREDSICVSKIISPDSISYYLRDTSLSPAYFVSGGALAIAKNRCVDCRIKGGTTTKPSYW